MKIPARLLALAAILALPLTVNAQNQLRFTFRGTCYETNAAGDVTMRGVTEKTLLKEIAQDAGNMDSSGWALVYHVGGNELGDTVEVINASTGQVLDTYFGLYFGEDQSLGRIALKGKTAQKRIDYIYTKQNSHSMGAAFVSKRQVGKALFIDGRMDWILAPMASKGIRVYTGSFRTGTAMVFKK